jgi:hypothetical protein
LLRAAEPNQTQTTSSRRATQAITGASRRKSARGRADVRRRHVPATPSFIDPHSQQTSRLNPTARLTIGKRISERLPDVPRSLVSHNDQRSDRAARDDERSLSWILSRNEDRQTYAPSLSQACSDVRRRLLCPLALCVLLAASATSQLRWCRYLGRPIESVRCDRRARHD